jgi:penicillin-binding protein 2
MFDAVNSPIGTAYLSRTYNTKKLMCGKTATSQVRRISMKEREEGIIKNEDLPRNQRDHALFVGYYPHIEPKYGFSVVVEHGGSGSKSAAPIAKDLCNKLDLIDS